MCTGWWTNYSNVHCYNQAVAPPGFQLHLDFTMIELEGHVQLCDQLAEYPCVGCFEDSFRPASLDAYKELKLRRCVPHCGPNRGA
jgi:hypothetical protein